jgi:hypothetical protein
VPIDIHPALPPESVRKAYYDGLPGNRGFLLSMAGFGWHVEVGVHVLRMVLAGTFEGHPRLKVVINHMGETIPFMLDRAEQVFHGQAKPVAVKETILKHVWLTTSRFFTLPPFLKALLTFGGRPDPLQRRRGDLPPSPKGEIASEPFLSGTHPSAAPRVIDREERASARHRAKGIRLQRRFERKNHDAPLRIDVVVGRAVGVSACGLAADGARWSGVAQVHHRARNRIGARHGRIAAGADGRVAVPVLAARCRWRALDPAPAAVVRVGLLIDAGPMSALDRRRGGSVARRLSAWARHADAAPTSLPRWAGLIAAAAVVRVRLQIKAEKKRSGAAARNIARRRRGRTARAVLARLSRRARRLRAQPALGRPAHSARTRAAHGAGTGSGRRARSDGPGARARYGARGHARSADQAHARACATDHACDACLAVATATRRPTATTRLPTAADHEGRDENDGSTVHRPAPEHTACRGPSPESPENPRENVCQREPRSDRAVALLRRCALPLDHARDLASAERRALAADAALDGQLSRYGAQAPAAGRQDATRESKRTPRSPA